MIRVDNYFYRSARPKNLQELKDNDIKVVICLESGIYDLLTDDQYENIDWPESGIVYYEIGLSDFTPPDLKSLRRILHAIRHYQERNANVLVHCLSGVDRTGFVCALYEMLFQGFTFKRAVALWKWYGRHWWYSYWTPFLKKRYNQLLLEFGK